MALVLGMGLRTRRLKDMRLWIWPLVQADGVGLFSYHNVLGILQVRMSGVARGGGGQLRDG